MTTERTPKAPIQTFKEGGVSIKLWEQNYGEDKRFCTATIEKTYKDKAGNWKQSRSFNETDIAKLQALLPEASAEMQQWQAYYKQNQQEQTQEQTPQPARDAEPVQQAPTPAPVQEQPQPDMAAQRDAAMRAAQAELRDPVRSKSRDR